MEVTMFTFTIELRVPFDDKERLDIVQQAIKTAAKHVYTTTMLIADGRQPQVAIHGGDYFTPTEEIMLADDLDE
jgi:hypothetical protein